MTTGNPTANSGPAAASPRINRPWSVALWGVQVVLAGLFLMAGYMKTTMPIDALVTQMAWVATVPRWLVRFIGTAEGLGAIGLVLPAATRILPRLSPLAALGLVVVQVLALGFHATRGELNVLPINIALAALAAFVAWGRTKKAPIAPRA